MSAVDRVVGEAKKRGGGAGGGGRLGGRGCARGGAGTVAVRVVASQRHLMVIVGVCCLVACAGVEPAGGGHVARPDRILEETIFSPWVREALNPIPLS